jgi:ferrous iron transport protein B
MAPACKSCSLKSCPTSFLNGGESGKPATDHYVVALAGNPNTGKSTLFNALTGLKQKTGNWPGKTVMRAEGKLTYGGRSFRIVDLPGTYSLLSTSQEEEIARDFLLFGRPDATIIVVDATCLERNLGLVLQILEITDRAVVCLNLMDEASRKGIRVDVGCLGRDLGVPVVPTVATTGQGLRKLMDAVLELAEGSLKTSPRRIPLEPQVARAVEELQELIEARVPGLPNSRWIALRLLEGDQKVAEALWSGGLTWAGSPRPRQIGAPLAVQEAFA